MAAGPPNPSDQDRRISPWQVSQGSSSTIRGPAAPGAFGRNTERFFVEGEQHEARAWQDILLFDEPKPRVRSGSFDKLPRQWSSMIALVLFGVLFLGGVGLGVRALAHAGSSVATAVSDSSKQGGAAPPEPGNATSAPGSGAPGARAASPVAAPHPGTAPEPAAGAAATAARSAPSAVPAAAARAPTRPLPRGRRPQRLGRPVAEPSIAPASIGPAPPEKPVPRIEVP